MRHGRFGQAFIPLGQEQNEVWRQGVLLNKEGTKFQVFVLTYALPMIADGRLDQRKADTLMFNREFW